MNHSKFFNSLEGKIWMNTAHQGILPKVGVDAAYEAIEWKKRPYKMTSERFQEIPNKLKEILGKLIDAAPEDVILANSSSYGLHLLSNGIKWRKGDEIILVKGDFPSTILPWLDLKKKGVRIRYIKPKKTVFTLEDLNKQVNDKTRLFCTNWVNSFNGFKIDEEKIGKFCREHGIISVLNCSQGIGAIPFYTSCNLIDAVTSVGFKWLCGPYGTGFCWIRPEIRESLEYNQAYWLSIQTAKDLETEKKFDLKNNVGAKKYDLFGTANFFNFKPWSATIKFILDTGLEEVNQYNINLLDHLINSLNKDRYNILSPVSKKDRSSIFVVCHKQRELNRKIYKILLERDIHIAFRRGNLRFSPHFYNTKDEINDTLEVMNAL